VIVSSYSDCTAEGFVGSRSVGLEINYIVIIIMQWLLGFVGELFVQVTTILGAICSCHVVMMHVRIAAVGTVMTWLILPSMCVAVVLISIGFGSSTIIILG